MTNNLDKSSDLIISEKFLFTFAFYFNIFQVNNENKREVVMSLRKNTLREH